MQHTQRRAGIVSKLGLAASMALAGGLATIAPAAAYTTANTGSAGVVSVQKTLGVPNQTSSTSRLYSGNISVYRSPASAGTQKITINWRIWNIRNNRWELVASPKQTWTVLAGQYVGTPGWYYDNIGGFFAVEYSIVWQNAAGTVIGTKLLDFVNAGDYQCAAGAFCYIPYELGQYVISVS